MTDAGNSTVVGDAGALRKDQRDAFLKPDSSNGTHHTEPQIPKVGNEFSFTTDDYLKERPFYVPIGKGGLTAALETLDQQLVEVRPLSPYASRPCANDVVSVWAKPDPFQEGR